jgi:hypothetical protein
VLRTKRCCWGAIGDEINWFRTKAEERGIQLHNTGALGFMVSAPEQNGPMVATLCRRGRHTCHAITA